MSVDLCRHWGGTSDCPTSCATTVRSRLASIPEPPELAIQAEAAAEQQRRNDEVCQDCGKKRSAHGWGSSTLTAVCVFRGGGES